MEKKLIILYKSIDKYIKKWYYYIKIRKKEKNDLILEGGKNEKTKNKKKKN